MKNLSKAGSRVGFAEIGIKRHCLAQRGIGLWVRLLRKQTVSQPQVRQSEFGVFLDGPPEEIVRLGHSGPASFVPEISALDVELIGIWVFAVMLDELQGRDSASVCRSSTARLALQSATRRLRAEWETFHTFVAVTYSVALGTPLG